MIEIKIDTDIIKLDSFLKWSGAVSLGSEAKIVIQQGDVKLNGEVETRRSKKLQKNDVVEYQSECYKII